MPQNGFEPRTGYSSANQSNPKQYTGNPDWCGVSHMSQGHRSGHRCVPALSLSTVVLFALLVAAFIWLTGPPPAHSHSVFPTHTRGVVSTASSRRPRHGTSAYRAWVVLTVFGPVNGPTALRIARCESHPWLDTNARDYLDGSHWGLFQVSSGLRRDYPGYGPGAWAQARHALKVFNAGGHSWSPWQASKHCWNR